MDLFAESVSEINREWRASLPRTIVANYRLLKLPELRRVSFRAPSERTGAKRCMSSPSDAKSASIGNVPSNIPRECTYLTKLHGEDYPPSH